MAENDSRTRLARFRDGVFYFLFHAVLALFPAAPWLIMVKIGQDQGNGHSLLVNLLLACGFWLLSFLGTYFHPNGNFEGAWIVFVLSLFVFLPWWVIGKLRDNYIHTHRRHVATFVSPFRIALDEA